MNPSEAPILILAILLFLATLGYLVYLARRRHQRHTVPRPSVSWLRRTRLAFWRRSVARPGHDDHREPPRPAARFRPEAEPAALPALPEPSVRPLLLAAPPRAVPEPILPDWVVARCTLQSSYFHGGCGGGDAARLTVRAAALRGIDHALAGQKGQDVAGVVWDQRHGALYAAAADGLGSLPDSGNVASDAVRHALDRCRSRVPAEDFGEFARTLFKEICLSIDATEPRVSGATTLIVAEVIPQPGGAAISVCGVGDSEAWMLRGGRWRSLHHERRLSSDNATRHLPGHPEPLAQTMHGLSGDVLLLGTDGFAGALGAQSPLGEELLRRWRTAPGPLEFLAHVNFYDGYRADDRAVVSIWIE